MAAVADDFCGWDKEEASDYDTATAGGRPGRHLMVRSMQAEIATSNSEVFAAAMWDIGTFFESVEPTAMLAAAQNEMLPKAPAALAVFGYASRRHLKLQNTFANTSTLPRRSISTGCHSATSFARAVLKRPTRASMAAAPSLRLTLHVDDFCQESSGSSATVSNPMFRGGSACVAEVKRARLTISPQSTLICNDLETGRLLCESFQQARCLPPAGM